MYYLPKIYVYRKKDTSREIFREFVGKGKKRFGYDEFTDLSRDYVAYNQMKYFMVNKPGTLVIKSLSDIGETKDEIYRELLWFKENNINLVVLEYPSTYNYEDELSCKLVLNVLIDVYKALQENKSFDIGATVNTTGRKKIKFPENWNKLYAKWEAGEITAKQFMDETGLKKGTFYHLINDYKELLEINKDSFSNIG